jgi:hypothetical protein
MKQSDTKSSRLQRWASVLALVLCCGATGCQIEAGGQILPSPWYLTDDVQYFAPGPEFKLSNEAAAIKEAAEEQVIEGR